MLNPRVSVLLVLAAVSLGGCACFARRAEPQPTSADLDARARAASLARAEAATCARLKAEAPTEFELPFAYAESGLTEVAQGRLEDARQWLRCTPSGAVLLAVETEHHYKKPDVEAALRTARADTVTGRLADAGVDPARIERAPDTAGARPALILRLRGRGW